MPKLFKVGDQVRVTAEIKLAPRVVKAMKLPPAMADRSLIGLEGKVERLTSVFNVVTGALPDGTRIQGAFFLDRELEKAASEAW